MQEPKTSETFKPEFRAMTPRFVVKDFDKAIEHYSKLGFQVNYRGEGFMILGRDAVEIQMNEDVDQVRGGSICYMTVSGIETIYKEISSKIPVDPCTGGHYSVNKQAYGVKEFALYDPFGNLLFFSEPTE
ncbi:MAG: glyoxalase superfamily protein [Nitrososphaerales archaeon]